MHDFDQDIIIGNAASERQENIVVSEGTNDRDLTVGTSSINTAINENMVNVKTLERCFNERIDREMSNIVDTVEDRIQNAILTAIDNIVAPKIELAIRSINASSGRELTSVTANSERGEHVGINASFENASGKNNTLHVSNINDETRHNIPNEVSELSVPGTQLDRQPHTHHNTILSDRLDMFSYNLHFDKNRRVRKTRKSQRRSLDLDLPINSIHVVNVRYQKRHWIPHIGHDHPSQLGAPCNQKRRFCFIMTTFKFGTQHLVLSVFYIIRDSWSAIAWFIESNGIIRKKNVLRD